MTAKSPLSTRRSAPTCSRDSWEPSGQQPQAKFEEYHPLPNGMIIEYYALDFSSGAYGMSFEAKNVDQLDQSFMLVGGEPGLFSYDASWDQTPHILSYDARTLYVNNGGVLTLDRRSGPQTRRRRPTSRAT